jgi:hypothetical protein
MPRRSPLPLPDDHWRSRWLVFPTWNRLHRVADIAWEGDGVDEMRQGTGTTLCGRRGFLTMPGILSRIGTPRCAHCCRLAGVPRGAGAPFNFDIEETASR